MDSAFSPSVLTNSECVEMQEDLRQKRVFKCFVVEHSTICGSENTYIVQLRACVVNGSLPLQELEGTFIFFYSISHVL